MYTSKVDADQKFLQFLRRRIRGEETAGYSCPPEDDLNNTPFGRPAWPAGWEHLTACPDMTVSLNAKIIDHTGYCETCIETAYRADFTVTCPHGGSEPAMWWEYASDIDEMFAVLDWDY